MFFDMTTMGKILPGVSQSLNVVYHSPAVMYALLESAPAQIID